MKILLILLLPFVGCNSSSLRDRVNQQLTENNRSMELIRYNDSLSREKIKTQIEQWHQLVIKAHATGYHQGARMVLDKVNAGGLIQGKSMFDTARYKQDSLFINNLFNKYR